MGDSKLYLLLLLSTSALAYAQEEEHPTCLLAKRYKTLHMYEYQYDAESLNAIKGASQLKNGPKVSCKVEMEVPQTCSYILRTTGCSLSEVVDTDAEGNPVFGPGPGSDAFAVAMEKHPLKVVVEGVYDVKLYPEEGETMTILNIKRGIVSALAVPLVEEEENKKMPTIHGVCKTGYSVNSREDIATDVTLTRDLSKCDHFVPQRGHTSPLALISGMHYPLAQLIRSSQTCNYKFDNEHKHMTSGVCTETHILVPFSHKGQYGVTNVGKQSLTLLEVSTYNKRVFDHNEANVMGLPMEAAEDKSVVQDKDAALAVLRELATLSQSNSGEKRAHLFQKLVTMVRGMKAETLSPAVPEALEVSGPLTYQVLAQCGTPECSSAIMQILRTFDNSAIAVDATVFAMGLLPNPSALLVNDILAMAQNKQSKLIMYALSNAVKRFYKAEGKVTPEIHAVAEFMAGQLGDCTGDQEHTFMTLRVIGNMGAALGAASPALKSAVIQCVNKPEASLAVQQAAIQAYRQTPVPEEGREVLVQVMLDGDSPLQKRIAAYLVLMKDPQPSELAQMPSAVGRQFKSFVFSHLSNILASTDPKINELRQKILDALQSNEADAIVPWFSRNYKVGIAEGNMIFDGSLIPKEVMLEMTLKAFGYDVDIVEVGMKGKGFEPTVQALFGFGGFLHDATETAVVSVIGDVYDVYQWIRNVPLLGGRRKRSIMRTIGDNFKKLVKDLKAQESPEAMVYLRLLGNELGYLKTNEMEEMAYSAALMIDNFLKMFPSALMEGLMTKADNEVFAHYIFMDNEFFLPTATGVPLKIALSGTFTAGIKGGLHIAPDMSEVSFMPSAGIEFVTHVGSHIPEYVLSGLDMHTNLYHESGLSAKVAMADNQVKLTIPAPQGPTKLISITNSLHAITSAEVKTIPPMVEDRVDVSECKPVFAGMQSCTTLQYTDASSHDDAPYFPFTGDSKLAVELHPTGEVSEYTATVGYELLREGEEGGQKVDMVKLVLKAEGAEPTEATASVKYNRRKHTVTADIQIPEFDLEAGLRLGVVDGNTKGKGTHSISIDLINKNIPQLSLVGRAKIAAMRDAMLQVQLLVPSLKADATVTANLKRGEELEFELESDIKLPETNSVQKITLKYDDSKIEAEIKSEINSEIQNILPQAETIKKMVNDVLDLQLGQTDVKVRHFLTKSVEATNNYLEKYAADIPYLQNLRVPEMPEITLPEKLFLNAEAAAAYHFNNERFTIAIPLPLGGKSTEELNFPAALTTPHLVVPLLGMELASIQIPIPELFVPETLAVSVPYFGKAEISTKMNSNLYNLEGSVSAGKDAVEIPSYSAKFEVVGSSPLDLLSIRIEGSGLLESTPGDSIKAHVKTSVSHKLLDASISIMEIGTVTDKINIKSSSKIEATSPLGLGVSLEHTGQAGVNTEEISGDSNLEAKATAGLIYGITSTTQSFTILPLRLQAEMDSTLKIDSTLLQAQNSIAASFANGELSFVSNTNAYEDLLTHVAELAFKENQLSMKCETNTRVLGMKIHNHAEASAGAGAVALKMETNADQSENHIYSLLTASMDVNGLAVNSDASVKLIENEAAHKATLTINKDGLTTSAKTTVQGAKTTLPGPLTMENTFNAGLDASRASLSIETKSAFQGMKFENANSLTVTLSTLAFSSKAEAIVSENITYTHDITIDLEPYSVSANMNNDLNLLEISLVNEAQLKAELYKVDLTGSLIFTDVGGGINHTRSNMLIKYTIKYADLTANARCTTRGRLLGVQISHNIELEVVGLAARIENVVRFQSRSVRLDYTVRASLIPFDFNLECIVNADGQQSFQFYAKGLIKAQPMAFTSSHECRASITNQLNSFTLEILEIDNKMDTLVTPQEQKATLTMKSKMNNHALSQEVNVFNNAERLGLEVSGTFLTDLLKPLTDENQEFTVSAFLKYDKSTESHMIRHPLSWNFVKLENVKITIVRMAEAVQECINSDDIKAKLDALPQELSDFVIGLNLEGKAVQLKQDLIALTQEYNLTLEDLDASLVNLWAALENLVTEIASRIQGIVDIMKEIIVSGTLPVTAIERLIKEYSSILLAVLDVIEELIKQLDTEKLKDSSIAILHDIDAQYELKAKLEHAVSELKHLIESFTRTKLVKDLRSYISSINLEAYIEELMSEIPTEIISKIAESVKEVIQEFDIIGKLNALHGTLREVIVKYEVDKHIEAVLEKVVELIKHFKIDETIQVVANNLKPINIPAKFMHMLEEVVNYLKATEMKHVINHLNEYLDAVVQKVKSFDYNGEANQMISEYTVYVNELIKALEIQQKLEASREFGNFVVSSAINFIERLREVKVVDMIKTLKDVIVHAVFNDLVISENLKQRITDMDLRGEIISYLQQVSEYYTKAITILSDLFSVVCEEVCNQPTEIKQIIEGIANGLKTAELHFPSFTIPLTDLDIPAMKISLDKLQEIEIPTQLDIPEFTLLGFHSVPATTISFDGLKQGILEIIDFIANFEIHIVDLDAFFGDLTMNYLPALPELTLPEIALPEFSFPALPKVAAEKSIHPKFIPTLQIPELKLPNIPSEIMVPSFGKLYAEVKVSTPINSFRTSAELQNSTDNNMTPQFTVFLTSQGTSTGFEILNYNLNSTTHVAIRRMSRVVVVETLKFTHSALAVEHQGLMTFYSLVLPLRTSTKTTIKVTTSPYNAELVNTAFFASDIFDWISASMDTTYKHNIDISDYHNEASLNQKVVTTGKSMAITLTVDADQGIHKSDLRFTINPRTAVLTFSGDTVSPILKLKQSMNVDAMFGHIKFNARSEAEGPAIKNSLVVASGKAYMGDVELKVTHDTELVGAVSGVLSNSINLVIRPLEVVFDFHNKGNTKLSLHDAPTAKIDLQNDYSATFKPDAQHINTVALARFNQYKYQYNFTIDNNNKEFGIYAAADGNAVLDLLNQLVGIDQSIITPAMSELNLYEITGLKYLLTTPQQSVDVDAKILYQKSNYVHNLGLVSIPSLGNLITELSFKSAIFNLNANAGLDGEDDLVLRIGATTASVFEGLKAKLDGTTRLTTKRGLKLATALSLENPHIEGAHDSTISLNMDEVAVSVATVAKIALPILNLEVNQQMIADTKTKANVASILKLKSDFNVPLIKTVGKLEADHSLKLEGTLEYISVESATKGNIEGEVLEYIDVLGVLDNEANIYLNADGLRSTAKIITNAKLSNHGTKVLELDVDENLAVEASLSHVYAALNFTSNNEANLLAFTTNGKHIAMATIDFAPMSSLTADVVIDMSQPSNLGDLTIFEKTSLELTAPKQKISATAKIVSPVYTTNLVAEMEGEAPVFKVTLKSSATSVIVFLDHDMDASITANVENEALSLTDKMILTHADLTLDVQHVLTQALSASRHTLNVDITSPTFTDANFRYAAGRDGVSASISTPSTGFLGLQLQGRVPSQLSARLYSRYVSTAEDDVDIFIIKTAATCPQDTDMRNLQVSCNLEAPYDMLVGLKDRLPAITSSLTSFADKYQITGHVEGLWSSIRLLIEKVYHEDGYQYHEDGRIMFDDVMLSELSRFFRTTVVWYQQTVQVFLDAAIKFLRETQFKVPGAEEMTTLPEVLKELTSGLASKLEQAIQTISVSLDTYTNELVQTAGRTLRDLLHLVLDLVKHLESLDMFLEQFGETLKFIVEKAQSFVDSLESDILNSIFSEVIFYYHYFFTTLLHNPHQEIMSDTVSGLLQQAKAYVKVSGGVLEVNLPFRGC